MATPTLLRRVVGVLVAVALTLGLAALASAPAEAARKKTVWDKVAACESGGRWKINTGNGYYGGLQFSGSTWRAFGGRKYAKQAHKASKGEQIAIARRVLASQGPGAWPTCSRKANLTKKNGKASKKATPTTNPGVVKKKKSVKKSKKVVASEKKASKTTSSSSSKVGVTVKSGDTLAKLARKYHVSGGWRTLWKLNKKTLRNPNTLRVGQVLVVKV